jgi:hypothetical protein
MQSINNRKFSYLHHPEKKKKEKEKKRRFLPSELPS